MELKKAAIKIRRDSVSGYFHAFTKVGTEAKVLEAEASKTAIACEAASCQNNKATRDNPPQKRKNKDLDVVQRVHRGAHLAGEQE